MIVESTVLSPHIILLVRGLTAPSIRDWLPVPDGLSFGEIHDSNRLPEKPAFTIRGRLALRKRERKYSTLDTNVRRPNAASLTAPSDFEVQDFKVER